MFYLFEKNMKIENMQKQKMKLTRDHKMRKLGGELPGGFRCIQFGVISILLSFLFSLFLFLLQELDWFQPL